MAHLDENRDGSQRPHDPANSQRVSDRLPQTIAFRDLKICHRARLVSPNLLNHVDRVRSPIQRPGAIRRCFDRSQSAQCLSDPPHNNLRNLKAAFVDIKQTDRRVTELGNERISPNKFLANTVLPAPIKVIFLDELLIAFLWDRSRV
jgi:hypothetical protein